MTGEFQLLLAAFFIYLAGSAFYVALFLKDSLLLRRLALWTFILGFLFHSGALVLRWKVSGHAPFSNTYESLLFFSWACVLTYFAAVRFLGMYRLGLFVLIFNLGLMAYGFSHDSSIRPLVPALQSHWMILHVSVCFLGYGALALSFLASVVYLTPLANRFFTPQQLEGVMDQAIRFGFPLLTLGIATGAIWANEAWGAYWSWDPKETWALITWLIYALYFHLRLVKRWGARRLAWVVLGAFLAVLFTYLGVNFLFSGLHSYV